MNANGPRYVQVTAAMLGAHGVSLGVSCLVVEVTGVDEITWKERRPEVPVRDLPSRTLDKWTVGLSLGWKTQQEAGLGCGEARDLKDVLREMSGGSWIQTQVWGMGVVSLVAESIVRL